jgi:hypothetical protein
MKGFTFEVYKWGLGDCTNGGISSKARAVTVIDPRLPEMDEPTADRPAVKIVTRDYLNYTHAEPIDPPPAGHVGWMMGGNFIYTCDSRGRAILDYPIPLHDRCETTDQAYANND